MGNSRKKQIKAEFSALKHFQSFHTSLKYLSTCQSNQTQIKKHLPWRSIAIKNRYFRNGKS